MADRKDILYDEAQTSDNQVLNKLAEKLTAYIHELSVLGFNSGKYDKTSLTLQKQKMTEKQYAYSQQAWMWFLSWRWSRK